MKMQEGNLQGGDMILRDLAEQTRGVEKTAIVCEDRRLSYQEFHEITDRISAALVEKELTGKDVVSVCMQKSERQICAIFGAIKAGVIFLIINMDWPKQRRDFVLADSHTKFIITDCNYSELVKRKTGPCADAAEKQAKNIRETSVRPLPDDVCAIYYTSGTSGNPKGVMLTHRNLVNTNIPVEGIRIVYEGCHRCSRVLDVLNTSFIAEQINFSVSLYAGNTLVLMTEKAAENPEKIVFTADAEQTDFVVMTPSVLRTFLYNPDFKRIISQMKEIVLMGEAVPQELADTLTELTGKETAIFGSYGATETLAALASDLRGRKVSLGYPVRGTQVYLLDEEGNEVREGDPGEICTSGVGVARGYIGLEEMNRRKFTVRANGERIYHTGDRGRRGSTGEIFYIGRMDRMVKLNGIRVELPEIEQTMLAVPEITAACVKICRDTEKNGILTAFYTTGNMEEDTGLREKLRKRLPDYMIPAVFIHLKKIPLTDRGKTDYAKLELLLSEERKEAYETPSDECEAAICSVFEKVLQKNQIGTADSFYELGGDSLRGLMVLSELRKLGYMASLEELFAHPKPRELAVYLKHPEQSAVSAVDREYRIGDTLCLTPEKEEAEKILSSEMDPENVEAVIALAGTERAYYMMPEMQRYPLEYYIDVQIKVRKKFSREKFMKKAENFVRSHPVLRSEMRSEGLSRPYQIIRRKAETCCFYQDLRGICDPEKITPESLWKNMDQEIESYGGTFLFVTACFLLTDTVSVLMLHTCHTVFDGLSINCFTDYFLSDQEEIEEDRYLSYRKWLYRKQKYNWEEATAFWKEYLKKPQFGMLPFKSLLPGGADITSRLIVLDREQTRKLERICIARKITTETCLQYLYGLSLMDVLNKDEVLYSVTFSGRTEEVEGMENTVGMLARYVPVRQKREESMEEYRDLIWKVQKYSYLERDEIWGTVLKKKTELLIDRGIIGNIYPYQSEKILQENSRYDHLVQKNDIRKQNGKLLIRFQFNASYVEENAVALLCSRMDERIRELLNDLK